MGWVWGEGGEGLLLAVQLCPPFLINQSWVHHFARSVLLLILGVPWGVLDMGLGAGARELPMMGRLQGCMLGVPHRKTRRPDRPKLCLPTTFPSSCPFFTCIHAPLSDTCLTLHSPLLRGNNPTKFWSACVLRVMDMVLKLRGHSYAWSPMAQGHPPDIQVGVYLGPGWGHQPVLRVLWAFPENPRCTHPFPAWEADISGSRHGRKATGISTTDGEPPVAQFLCKPRNLPPAAWASEMNTFLT